MRELLLATNPSPRPVGLTALDIAAKHGKLYKLANSHLPFGYSEYMMASDDHSWKLEVRIPGKQPAVLDQSNLEIPGLRVKPQNLPAVGGGIVKRLTIHVYPVKP